MQRRFSPLRSLGLSLVIASLTFAASSSEAARVTKVGGGKVLIDGSDSDVALSQGGRYVVIVGGKRKAIIEITQVKGNKAIGRVLKGRAAVNGTLQPLGGAKTASSGSQRARSGGGSDSPFGDLTFGAVAGYAMDSQSVTVTSTDGSTSETIAMSGSGFSVKGFGDMPVSGPIGVIGRVGIEQFNVSGSSTSLGSRKTSIMYATVDLMLRYNFMEGDIVPFGAIGLGIHFPLSKTSDVLNTQQVSSTSVFFFTGGLNYKLSDTMYLTAMGEYGFFPPSNEVKTSMIAGRAGVGFRF